MLKTYLPFKLSALGDPSTDFGAWVHLITSYPAQWKQLVRNLASPVSVLDKHGSTPQLGSAQQNFACLECAHRNVQRTFFTQRALNMHLLMAHGRRSQIAQFIGPDNRCPVCHTTFALRYLAIAHASQSKPRSGAAVSCRQVILSGSVERLSQEVLKPLVLEARRLRTTARRMGKSHVPAPWTAQRVRRPPPCDGDDSSQPQKRIRWTPVLCCPVISDVKPTLDSDIGDSPVHKRVRRQLPSSLPRSDRTPPFPSDHSPRKRRRWSEFAIIPQSTC